MDLIKKIDNNGYTISKSITASLIPVVYLNIS